MGHTNTRMKENYARASEKLISNEMSKIEEMYKNQHENPEQH